MPICLVIMPFVEELEFHFKLIEQCGSDFGMEVRRVDTYSYSGNILQAISKALSGADLIVADLSFANPNVMYELAIAHCLGKKVLLLTNDRNTIPFDLQSFRVEMIDPKDPGQADRLRQAFRLVLAATYITGPLGGRAIFGQRLFFRRLAAVMIDLIVFAGVFLLIFWVRNTTEAPMLDIFQDLKNNLVAAIFGLTFLLLPIYTIVSTGVIGGTLGHWLLRIKVVTMEGEPVPFWRSVGRAVSLLLSLLTYGIGFLWCLSGPSFRTFHDIASQTLVVRRKTLAHGEQLGKTAETAMVTS